MLQGDLNEVQQGALSFYLAESDRRKAETEWMRLKFDVMLHRPDLLPALRELEQNTEAESEFAARLTDDEIAVYQPLSGEEVDSALTLFEDFGLRMDETEQTPAR